MQTGSHLKEKMHDLNRRYRRHQATKAAHTPELKRSLALTFLGLPLGFLAGLASSSAAETETGQSREKTATAHMSLS